MKMKNPVSMAYRAILHPRRLKGHASDVIKYLLEQSKYSEVYKRYAADTMIPQRTYVNNLSLVDARRHVAGCIVECGVWRGGMIAGMAEVLGPSRHFVLFDSFEGLPKAKEIDGRAAIAWQADTGSPTFFENCAATREYAERAMERAGASRVTVKAGWFKDTLPGYVPPEPIAVLRLDGDWYESTMVCLETLFPFLVPGGIIIIDDYSAWDGCRRAVHDYLVHGNSPGRILQWRDDVTYIESSSVKGDVAIKDNVRQS